MSFNVPSSFFCVFKTGDNVNYNLSILRTLYDLSDKYPGRAALLLKPKTFILTAVIEAILHDFHVRIRSNNNEGIEGLFEDAIQYIRNKKIDEFDKYIQSAKHHDLFDAKDSDFYEALNNLRLIRNRIHIQNKYNHKPADEDRVFTNEVLINSEKCLEKIAKVMNSKYPRLDALREYVAQMIFPWIEHFD